ncbi:MAG: amidohydrolase family protein [Actinomycetota bacterium]|nr:amidohydrolase family protein [Actinomycetota bacterium]
MENPTPKIDVHHHIAPPPYRTALAARGVESVGGRPIPAWDLEETLGFMDRQGIETAMLSVSAPGVFIGDLSLARELARSCNEYLAGLVREQPRRFGAFAVLPLPDVEAALEEVAYALDELGLDGISLLSSVDGRYMGDPAYRPLFEELDRRGAVVFMHPHTPEEDEAPKTGLPPSLIEFVFETTRAVASLLFRGTLERCPRVRLILPHAGGTVPFIAIRLTLGQFWPGLQEHVPKGVVAYLRELYYDTAISAAPFALRSLQELVDDSHILFGSDYPFAPELAAVATVSGLNEYPGFDEASREAVFHRNARALFPRLRMMS